MVNQNSGQQAMLLILVWLMLLRGCLPKWLVGWIQWNSFWLKSLLVFALSFCFCFFLQMSWSNFIDWSKMSDSFFVSLFNTTRPPCINSKFEREIVGLFQVSQKESLFQLLWQPRALGVNLKMWNPSCTLQKGLPLSFSLANKRIYLDNQLNGQLTDLFWKFPGCSLFPRVGIAWWTLLQ